MTLKEARLAMGFTQKELAEIAEVNHSLIGKLERNNYNIGNVTARSYIKICDAVGLDPHDLLPEESTDRRGGNFGNQYTTEKS